ncbi:MAG: NUDIX hydrolase [Candidatus Methanomethyliaceae archaeon]|nr:NUDIX hydrolase [Candidatus Methanomethyliaceae archaeon]
MPKNCERIISSRSPFSGKLIKIRIDQVVLPSGRKAEREIVIHRGAVAIVGIKDREVLMERQYRHTAGKILWEIPAGTLEEGEDPKACAKRELMEETGYIAGKMKKLAHFYVAPGYSTEVIYVYLASELKKDRASPEEDESIETRFIPIEEAYDMIKTNKIEDAKTMLGLLLAQGV